MKKAGIILAGIFLIGTATIAMGQQGSCVSKLTGLSAQQTEKVNELNKKHLQTMTELRNERRSTTDLTAKNNVRAEMLKERDNHLAEMKKVLTADQWTEFQSVYQTGVGGGQGRLTANRGAGNGKGQGKFTKGRGQGKTGQAAGRGRGQGNFRNNPNCLRNSNI